MHLDINECEKSNGGCQHQCININGSYTCQCNGGFILNSNGKTCTGKFWIESSLKYLLLISRNCSKLSIFLAADSKYRTAKNNWWCHKLKYIKWMILGRVSEIKDWYHF